MKTTPAADHDEYCGALPGLSAAGARVPCPTGECPMEGICRALKRLDHEAGRARATRDAETRYVAGLLAVCAQN
jgi:hypothetical protein